MGATASVRALLRALPGSVLRPLSQVEGFLQGAVWAAGPRARFPAGDLCGSRGSGRHLGSSCCHILLAVTERHCPQVAREERLEFRARLPKAPSPHPTPQLGFLG